MSDTDDFTTADFIRALGSDPDDPEIIAGMEDAKDLMAVLMTLGFKRSGADPHVSTLQTRARRQGKRLRLVLE